MRANTGRCRALALPALSLALVVVMRAPWPVCATILSKELDSEIAELHAVMEENWDRVANLTQELQAAGALPQSGAGAGLGAAGGLGTRGPVLGQTLPVGGAAQGALAVTKDGLGEKAPPEMLEPLRKLQSEFVELQRKAFRIGQESADNEELAQHPDLYGYVQDLRDLRPRLEDAIADVEREYRRITGKEVVRPKKRKKKGSKTIQGLAEEDIRKRVREKISGDSRPFRTRSMDVVSAFRERQMQMQETQRDMQNAMDGPDWPKEDWPLTSSDALAVGDAEALITKGLGDLNARLDKFGGLARVHESDDEDSIEQLLVLNEMMVAYGEIIDRHVDSVKRVYRSKKRKSVASNKPVAPPSAGKGHLRDRLMNFGNGDAARPFAWLRNDGEGPSPIGSAPAGGLQAGAFGGGGAPLNPGSFGGSQSSFGGLGGFGNTGFQSSQGAQSTQTFGGGLGAFVPGAAAGLSGTGRPGAFGAFARPSAAGSGFGGFGAPAAPAAGNAGGSASTFASFTSSPPAGNGFGGSAGSALGAAGSSLGNLGGGWSAAAPVYSSGSTAGAEL